MIPFLQSKLSYNKTEKRVYLSKRLCGVWLIWVGLVLILSLVFAGGDQPINQLIFYIGYGAGIGLLFGNKTIKGKLSFGPPSVFQNKMTVFAFILMFLLMSCLGGPYYGQMNYEMIWMGVLMAVAIHFIPFAYVHGRSMLYLSGILIVLISWGYLDSSVAFSTIGYADAGIKMLFGIYLLYTKNPLAHK
ncbi:DUF6609 family protein [Paenibacillus sp. NPDC058071]|uniref:DUF6609 family protein n=1 Tax=Paenibacillus sp. NPDC058071 TaxID=3346326 RepID=UPI0036DF2E39